ncbi:hypothetical protein Q4Q34_01715 [Flavivirga abyssicola]|uniref:hypothetical protein n=1 Tax=Flavivirga abyssicola TaxID=3063533 RepID=UPI0026DED40C|nr:hypothetical protein [Flavivirga sp. MEBiC07777]WVK13757.1 hypothetical protein Q4Q34_01715 [Flavivirga sp. MEBiC07777]
MKRRSFNFFRIWLIAIFSMVFFACSSNPSGDDVQQEDLTEENEEEENNNTDDLFLSGETTTDRLTDNEDRFYENKIPSTEVIANLNGNCSPQDSDLLSQQILDVSNSGGGIIRITAGTYCFTEVVLRSNIHLKIDTDVTIQPDLVGWPSGKNLRMFLVGEDFYVENVAITNSDEDNMDPSTWFKANIPEGDYGGVRFVEYGYVKNFKFSGMSLTDSYSKFSNIVLNLPSSENVDEISRQGVVKDIVMTGMHVGYGVVQMQSGKTVLYKNLDGEGGVTLRVETGAAATNQVNEISVDDVVGRDITSRNGDAAFNMSPHRVDQGRVDIERVVSINSTHAVQIAAGFIGNKPGLIENKGTFDSRSYIGDITVTGGEGAQVKGKDFKYFDCDDRRELILRCKNPDESSTPGHSIGAIRDNAAAAGGCTGPDNGCYEVVVGDIRKKNTDFEQEDFFIFPTNAIGGCPQVTVPSDGSCN